MTWIDTIVVSIVVVVGLVIFYKALKEPLDILFGWIGAGLTSLFGFVKEKANNTTEKGYEVITYG